VLTVKVHVFYIVDVIVNFSFCCYATGQERNSGRYNIAI